MSNYEITFYPGAFKNVYDINHDTLKFKFSAQKLEFYGKLVINLSGIYSPVIVQLLDKDKVMYEKFTDKDGPVLFDYLQPNLYILKLIYDNNRDHEWTSGDFIKRKQAEKVIFYKEKINVRSNWDIDISWTP